MTKIFLFILLSCDLYLMYLLYNKKISFNY